MKADKFVRVHNELVSQLASSTAEVERFLIEKKAQKSTYLDNFSSLLNNFRLHEVMIGDFTFFDGYKMKGGILQFGTFDMDTLGINLGSKEVVLLDHQSVEYKILMTCCKDSDAFMDVLSIYFQRFLFLSLIK